MQHLLSCTHCGAEIPAEARFCRSCGQRSKQLDRPSVTEGTTRLLETPEQQDPFKQNVFEQPASLAQATNRLPPQANQTSRGLETTDKSRQRVLTGALLVVILMLTTLAIVLWNRPSGTTTVSPPTITRPDLPPAKVPPPPLPPQGVPQGGTINPAFIYPGARTTMEITNPAEGNMLQLQTSDAFDKVVNWYTEKLKPKSFVKQENEQGRSVVLAKEGMAAIITANETGTTIMLTQGDD